MGAVRAWLMAMDSLGYDHHVVFLNSMHAQSGRRPAVAGPHVRGVLAERQPAAGD
ncbi:gp65 domain protein [Mycobacterium xenopi 3993]|nr:gp65 domain protein [Mycobacterium xenopi 3993]